MFWVRDTAKATGGFASGSVVLIACEDITQRRRAEADIQFFKDVIDQTHDPIFWDNPADGFRFVYVNAAACRHFGVPAETLLTMSVPDVDPEYSLHEMERFWAELKRTKSRTIETVHRRADGELVSVEVTTNYVASEGKEYIVGTIRDIRERKRAEHALRDSEEAMRRSEAYLSEAQRQSHTGSSALNFGSG
jgi:PAS domain S-box-containing protein